MQGEQDEMPQVIRLVVQLGQQARGFVLTQEANPAPTFGKAFHLADWILVSDFLLDRQSKDA